LSASKAGRQVPVSNTVDVLVQNEGSLFIFWPETQAAKDWVEENVHLESYQLWGHGFVVEPRYAVDLAAGMAEDGLVVR